MLTAIIVEDMTDALTLLKKDIETRHPEIEIIATAQSVVAAAKVLRKHEPDILFLDIMLGDGTGFDILEMWHLVEHVQSWKSELLYNPERLIA